MEIKCRIISKGIAHGKALVSTEPISFYGGVDPDTGIVVEKGHCLKGKSISGKVLLFPCGKGSTVGSYILYRLKKNTRAPAAIVNIEAEPIVAVGAIISEIPMLDKPCMDIIKTIKDNQEVTLDANKGIISIK